MEIKPEETELEKPQEIRIGQEFFLFDPSYIKPRPEDPRLFERRFTLITNIDDIPRLDFRAEIGFLDGGNDLHFLPFEPEKGYHITREDSNPETRRKKMEKILQNRTANSPEETFTGEFMFTLLGKEEIPEEYRKTPDFRGNIIQKLKQLRLQFTANNMHLEGKGMPNYYDDSGDNWIMIYIARFYPADFGELPSVWPNSKGLVRGEEGQIVSLPNSKDKLSQITASFIFRNENKFEARRPRV